MILHNTRLVADRHEELRCGTLGFLSRAIRGCIYFMLIISFLIGAPLFYSYARLRCLFLDPIMGRRMTRSVIHSGACLLFRVLEITGVLRVTWGEKCARNGGHEENQGVIVANHPSMLDALIFLSYFPQIVCVMKSPLLKVPVIGGFARAAGYLPYNETPELWKRARVARDEGASILIFPEGTRSPRVGLGAFKRGAARLARELRLPIRPYVLEMNPIVLNRETPWWRPPTKVIAIKLRCLPVLNSRPSNREGASNYCSESNRRECITLTESLEELINSSLSSPPEEIAETLV